LLARELLAAWLAVPWCPRTGTAESAPRTSATPSRAVSWDGRVMPDLE
jgi:hypothetical protein